MTNEKLQAAIASVRGYADPASDRAAFLSLVLSEATGTTCGYLESRMTADEQRAIFGRYLGKGIIQIDGERAEISMRVKVCFGTDCDERNITHWRDLK
jgi:hypothetical protein